MRNGDTVPAVPPDLAITGTNNLRGSMDASADSLNDGSTLNGPGTGCGPQMRSRAAKALRADGNHANVSRRSAYSGELSDRF